MKKLLLILVLVFSLSNVCSAQEHDSFTFLGQSDGVAAFLYNDDIHVKSGLYMFNIVVRNTNNATTTVMSVIANKKEHWFVYTGALVELPDGKNYQSVGDITQRSFDDNSPVGRAIYYIDKIEYLF